MEQKLGFLRFFLWGLLRALSGRNEGEKNAVLSWEQPLLFRSESFSAHFSVALLTIN